MRFWLPALVAIAVLPVRSHPVTFADGTTLVVGSTTPGPGWQCADRAQTGREVARTLGGGTVLPAAECPSYTYPAP